MAYINKGDGIGISARGDLSANVLTAGDPTAPLRVDQIVAAARALLGFTNEARRRNSSHVFVPVLGAVRLVNVLRRAAAELPTRARFTRAADYVQEAIDRTNRDVTQIFLDTTNAGRLVDVLLEAEQVLTAHEARTTTTEPPRPTDGA